MHCSPVIFPCIDGQRSQNFAPTPILFVVAPGGSALAESLFLGIVIVKLFVVESITGAFWFFRSEVNQSLIDARKLLAIVYPKFFTAGVVPTFGFIDSDHS